MEHKHPPLAILGEHLRGGVHPSWLTATVLPFHHSNLQLQQDSSATLLPYSTPTRDSCGILPPLICTTFPLSTFTGNIFSLPCSAHKSNCPQQQSTTQRASLPCIGWPYRLPQLFACSPRNSSLFRHVWWWSHALPARCLAAPAGGRLEGAGAAAMDGFHILELIGEGSFGRVYKGRRRHSKHVR